MMPYWHRIIRFFLGAFLVFAIPVGIIVTLKRGYNLGLIASIGGGGAFASIMTFLVVISDLFGRVLVKIKYGIFSINSCARRAFVSNSSPDVLYKNVLNAVTRNRIFREVNHDDSSRLITAIYGRRISYNILSISIFSDGRIIIESQPNRKTIIFDQGKNVGTVELIYSEIQKLEDGVKSNTG